MALNRFGFLSVSHANLMTAFFGHNIALSSRIVGDCHLSNSQD